MRRRNFIKNTGAASIVLSQIASRHLITASESGPTGTPEKETVFMALDPSDFPVLENAVQLLEQGQTHPQNPILLPRPGEWDGTRCKVYGTVLYDYDERIFKMWYSGGTDTPDAVRRRDGSPRHVGYAISSDGVHWDRPILGVVEFNGSRRNNLIHLNAQAPTVYIQKHETDPRRRYLMLTEAGLDTARNKILYSPDGIKWEMAEEEPIVSRISGRTHEPFSILFDPDEPNPERRWKGYSLLHVSKNGYRGRAVGLFLGTDPQHWVEYPEQPIMSAVDGMESEIHLPHVTKFHGRYVMLYDAMEPNHHTQTELAISHDGIRFFRIQNGVKVIPNGKPGQPDAGKICVSPRSLFTHEGKIWWYYTMSADTYQTGPRGLRANPWHRYVGLAQWRADGFASYKPVPGAANCQVTTRAIEAGEGISRAWINAAIPNTDGGLTVEILDENSKVLVSSKPWFGNHLRREIQWNDNPWPLISGKKVSFRIRFNHPSAKVFAFGIPGKAVNATGAIHLSSRRPRDKHTREIWKYEGAGKISASPCVYGDKIYFGSWDQHIYSLNRDTGELAWKLDSGNAVTTSPVAHNHILFTGSRSGLVYAIESSSGKIKWKVPVSGGRTAASPNGPWIDSSPVIGAFNPSSTAGGDAPQRLYIGCHNRDFHAFNLSDGTEEWRFPTFNWILCQPFVSNYRVYFGSLDGRIYCVDARCGALIWDYTVGKYLRYADSVIPGSIASEGVAGSALVDGGTLFCGADDGFIYALDAATGEERWIFQTEKWIWGRPLVVGNVVVVASADGRVYGLDRVSGKRLWARSTENGNYADVIAVGKLALVASTSGRLYAIDPITGEVAWHFDAGAGLRAAPAVSTDGVIYLPTCDGTLYALKA